MALLFATSVMAQDDEVPMDSVQQSTETEEVILNMPVLSSAAILFDYGKLIGLALDTETKYEMGAQIEFKNIFVILGEYGIAEITPKKSYQNANYLSSGTYYRLGVGYKKRLNKKNNLILSVRYGRSDFRDEAKMRVISPSGIYDDLTIPFKRDNLTATWYEVVLSSESRLWKGLYAGFHFRFRMLDKYQEQQPIDTYTIPGYGRTFDATVPALNLYVKYALERF
jgi:hypothetical protein